MRQTRKSSIRLTQEGINMVNQARIQKGWKKTESAWADFAFVSQSTLKRFIAGQPISPQNFISLCETIGIHEWQSLVDWEESDITTTTQLQGNADNEPFEKLKSKNNRLGVTGVFALDKRLEVQMALEHLKQLLLDCKIVIKRAEDNQGGFSIYGFFSPNKQLEIEIALEHLKKLLVTCTVTIM